MAKNKIMNIPQEHYQRENEKLRFEIEQLKKNLEKEEFLHRTLYKQWNELNNRILLKENEFKRFKVKNLLYKYTFYLILISVVSSYYFMNTGKGNEKDDKKIPVSQAASSTMLTTHEAPTTNPEKIKVPDEKLVEKVTIAPDAIRTKTAAIVKQVVNKPLNDSVRNFIYWEGWSAYYEKSNNPYQKFSQEYEVWLEGWKEGEEDAKKILAKNSSDTLK